MNTQVVKGKKWSAKPIALLLTAAVVASIFILSLGSSLAAPADISVTLGPDPSIIVDGTIEVGQTKNLSTTYLFEAYSTDPSRATVAFTPGGSGIDNVRTTGVKAGLAGIAFGTENGVINTLLYQITNSNNVSAYTIKNGGEVYFAGTDVTKSNIVTVIAGNYSSIEWRSMNADVATVNSSGSITSKGIGATIIIGSFIDKWGVPRDLHLLVGVGVKLSDSRLSDLLELIKAGEKILGDGNDYTTDSRSDLADAVDGGKDVVNSNNPSDKAIEDAIKELEDAINGMIKKPTTPPGVIGPDGDGNYYKPVGDPENVYEVVDENGNSKQPPEYVYNPDGDPVNKSEENQPAYPKDGFYYVEDPEGSNIYKQVNQDGTLKDSPAIWGGPDGKFGGGDDETVYKYGNDYWKHLGQNVWQKVDKSKPTELDPTLIGGGPDENPATDPVTPIYKHGDKYYVGPLPPGTDNGYYYGDKQTGGDGKLNSSATDQHSTDDKYYLVNGQMVPESQLSSIPGLEDTNNGDTIVIDGMEWTKVKTDSTGKYAMLVLNDVLPGGPVRYDDNSGFNQEYNAADIRGNVDSWYKNLNAPLLKKFASEAMIGSDDIGTWPASSPAMGIYAFIPKKADISSLTVSKRGLGYDYWTSTKTTSSGAVGFQVTVKENGDWHSKGVTQKVYIRPAIWVKQK